MEEAYYHGRCAVRAQPVGAPISARSLKNLNGEDSSGDRPQSSSPQNAAAVGSSARHRAGDCPSQSPSFTRARHMHHKANVELSGQLTGARSRREEHVQVQVPRAKRPVRAPETTPASSLGRCSATPRSSSASSSGAGAGASATSIVVAARPPRRRGGEQCDKLPRHVVERRLFLAPWLVWRGGEGREALRERRVKGQKALFSAGGL